MCFRLPLSRSSGVRCFPKTYAARFIKAIGHFLTWGFEKPDSGQAGRAGGPGTERPAGWNVGVEF